MQNFKFLCALLAAGLLSSNLVNAANIDQLPDITHHDDWSSSGYVVPGIPYLSLPVERKYFRKIWILWN
ncbi:hypothetical protein [Parachitinimonas caeni]|uniref:Secreted protein n=1 Tax=Parachitinimonas caeni TaxID=3031301 RepID=A0ABT7DWB6_9NEIS|nr:hypothetical protein [Parachitinimonas caeni]MDK2124356.1 hypothetical protein [Parachitinimonas caeni]